MVAPLMTIKVPTEVPALLLPGIQAATELLESNAIEDADHWRALSIDRDLQDVFLTHFSKNFNLSLSLTLAGAKPHQLMRWRSTEIEFTQRYNDIHSEWKAKLITSAMTRAVGYLSPCDKDHPTVSGYVEDAAGTPIVQGADSRLTLRMLEAHFPETYSQKIDIGGSTDGALLEITDDMDAATAADAYAMIALGK